jgi:hypothetical protein
MRHYSDADVRAFRMAQAAAVNPDLRELKRCGWATSHQRFAPCELPMGHNGQCYNGDDKRGLAEHFKQHPELLDKLREFAKQIP